MASRLGVCSTAAWDGGSPKRRAVGECSVTHVDVDKYERALERRSTRHPLLPSRSRNQARGRPGGWGTAKGLCERSGIAPSTRGPENPGVGRVGHDAPAPPFLLASESVMAGDDIVRCSRCQQRSRDRRHRWCRTCQRRAGWRLRHAGEVAQAVESGAIAERDREIARLRAQLLECEPELARFKVHFDSESRAPWIPTRGW